MKKLTRLLALLSALALTVGLCACGGSPEDTAQTPTTLATTAAATTAEKPTVPPTEPTTMNEGELYDAWHMSADLSKPMNETIAAALDIDTFEPDETFYFPLLLTLSSDDTYVLETDSDELAENFSHYLNTLHPAICEALYLQGEQLGYEREEYEQQLSQRYGMPTSDYVQAWLDKLTITHFFGEVPKALEKGSFTCEDVRMDFRNIVNGFETYTVEFFLDGDTLYFDAYSGTAEWYSKIEQAGNRLPFVFKRAD